MNIPSSEENTSGCPICNHKVGWKDRYCSNCGELLKGAQIENFKNNYCTNCGKKIKRQVSENKFLTFFNLYSTPMPFYFFIQMI